MANQIFSKIMGWALLVIGIGLIAWSVYSSVLIFTNIKETPQIFKLPAGQGAQCPQCPVVISDQTKTQQQIEGLQSQINKMIEGQLKGQINNIIPPELIYKIFNLVAWAFFAGLLIFAGGQISNLGAKLIKT